MDRDWFSGLDYPRALLLLLVLGTVIGIVGAATTSTAAFGVYNPTWEGTSAFRDMARNQGLDTEILRESSRYGDLPGNGTLTVVLSPRSAYTDVEVARMRAFVRSGGTLLVAEDVGGHTNPLLEDLGVESRIDGRVLRDERYYHRTPAMPHARNVSNATLVDGVDALTLNYGTSVQSGNATVLVRTSDFAYLDTDQNGTLDGNETIGSRPVATAEQVGGGRVIVVGDPSIFINTMLDQPGNRAFAHQLLVHHDRLVLDYTHASRLPPLALAILVLRDSPPLQLLLGGLVLLTVGGWGERGVGLGPLKERIEGGRAKSTPVVNAESMANYLAKRHPEWDEERVERVVERTVSRRNR